MCQSVEMFHYIGAGHTHTWMGKGDGTCIQCRGGVEETSSQVNRRRHPYPQLHR